MNKFKIIFSLILGLTFFSLNTAQANSDIKHAMTFDIGYSYLFTKPNAHMGVFGLGYEIKTDSNITFNLQAFGGYGKVVKNDLGDINGFGVLGMKFLPGYALDLTDTIYVNFASGFGFSFTSSKIGPSAVSGDIGSASIITLKIPVKIDFVFEINEAIDLSAIVEYAPIWQNLVSFSTSKLHEKWRFANEFGIAFGLKYKF